MNKKIEVDYSRPIDEINYDVKSRKKRRRGEEPTEPRKKKAPPYKREPFKGLPDSEMWVADDGWVIDDLGLDLYDE